MGIILISHVILIAAFFFLFSLGLQRRGIQSQLYHTVQLQNQESLFRQPVKSIFWMTAIGGGSMDRKLLKGILIQGNTCIQLGLFIHCIGEIVLLNVKIFLYSLLYIIIQGDSRSTSPYTS